MVCDTISRQPPEIFNRIKARHGIQQHASFIFMPGEQQATGPIMAAHSTFSPIRAQRLAFDALPERGLGRILPPERFLHVFRVFRYLYIAMTCIPSFKAILVRLFSKRMRLQSNVVAVELNGNFLRIGEQCRSEAFHPVRRQNEDLVNEGGCPFAPILVGK